jgi:type I restriction enzyme S subunit
MADLFTERRLKYAATINDETLSETTDSESELTYIDIGNVDSQGRVHAIINYRFEDAPSRARRIVRDGDVIISTVRTYLQAIAHIEDPQDNLIVSTGFAVVRPSQVLDHRFCKYALRANRFLWEVQSRSTGVSYPAINATDLADIRINLPEVGVQRPIANYLDLESARIDRLIAEKERMLALLDEKRSALISRVVTSGLDPNAPLKPSGHEWLGEIPAHWGLQRLKQLAEVRGGLTLGKQYSGVLLQFPYLRVANVQDGYLNLDDVLTIDVPASEAASNLLAYGDVLMNEGGDIDKLGRGCVWRDEVVPCLHQNHVFAVRPHSVDADWLALWTSTLQAKRYFESRAKRSTNLASISGWNVKELPIPLPPIAEQLAIHQFLADQHSLHEALCNELRDSLRLLTERRAALITAAVTGQIPLEVMVR